MTAPTPAKAAEPADLREALGRLWCKAEGLDPDDVISDAGHTVLCATLGGLDPKVTAAFNEAAAPIIAAHATEIQARDAEIAGLKAQRDEARAGELEADARASAAHDRADSLAQDVKECRTKARNSGRGHAAVRAMSEKARAVRLAVENAVLKVALKPFAEGADDWSPEQNGGHVFHDSENLSNGDGHLTVGHLRAARAALKTKGGEDVR